MSSIVNYLITTIIERVKKMIPDISYFVLDYNPNHNLMVSDWLYECLESIYNNTSKDLSKMVYILSQGNLSEHEDYLIGLSRKFSCELICMRKNLGISRGINHCVRLMRSPVIGMVTNDTVFTNGMDVDLFDMVTKNNDIFQAMPISNKSNVGYQQYDTDIEFGNPDIKPSNEQKNINCLAHELTVMFWRKDIFDIVGFYDEQWKACYENLDFGLRCFMAGGRNVISGNSLVWHRQEGCIKSGDRDHSYDGYIEMNGTFQQDLLARLWHNKWRGIESIVDLYQPVHDKTILDEPYRQLLYYFRNNIYLPYVQNVGY